MATDVMRVRLHLRRIRVLEVLVDAPAVLRVRVESTGARLRCPYCGFKCHIEVLAARSTASPATSDNPPSLASQPVGR